MYVYCNLPGHTFMLPNAMYRIVFCYTAMLAEVVSTACWAACVTVCKASSSAIDSVLMEQILFYKFRPYLNQMYILWQKDNNHKNLIMLDYHWANFGCGPDDNSVVNSHSHEVWLRKGNIREGVGGNIKEWYKEKPLRVCMAKNVKYSVELPKQKKSIVLWMENK